MKKGWEKKKLGDLIELISGQHIDSKDYNMSGRGVGYLTGPSDFGPIYPVVTKWTEYPKVKSKENDILITVKGSGVGRVNLTGADEVAISRQLMAIRVVNAERQFVYLLLESAFDHFQKESTGAAIPGISREQVLGFPIPLPPLPEQQRIVGILDEAFGGLATAQAHAAQNLQNARDLFESHLNAVFTQRCEGWVEKTLKEVCEKITDGTHQTPKYFESGVVFLSSRNVTSGQIDWENVKYIDEKQHSEMHRRVAPRRNDILLAKNGTTGVAAIVDRDTVFDIYVSLAHLRTLPVLRPRFLLHFINSPVAKVQFNKRLKGVGVPNLHLEEIREVRIDFPADIHVQDQVVAQLDALSSETQRLARIYEQKLAALAELKKSLLHQAFSGDL